MIRNGLMNESEIGDMKQSECELEWTCQDQGFRVKSAPRCLRKL